jgi:hypothetical protein
MQTQSRYQEEFLGFVPYLSGLNMPMELMERCQDVFGECAAIAPEPVKDVFVTDSLAESGEREYEDFLCFSPNYCVAAKDFTEKTDLYLLPIARRFTEYKLVEGDIACKEIHCDGGYRLLLRAAGQNCECLADIFEKYIEPNLAPSRV